MHNELQKDVGTLKDLAYALVAKAICKSGSQTEDLEKFLKNDEPREGRQSLIFEPQLGNRNGFPSDVFLATLHA